MPPARPPAALQPLRRAWTRARPSRIPAGPFALQRGRLGGLPPRRSAWFARHAEPLRDRSNALTGIPKCGRLERSPDHAADGDAPPAGLVRVATAVPRGSTTEVSNPVAGCTTCRRAHPPALRHHHTRRVFPTSMKQIPELTWESVHRPARSERRRCCQSRRSVGRSLGPSSTGALVFRSSPFFHSACGWTCIANVCDP